MAGKLIIDTIQTENTFLQLNVGQTLVATINSSGILNSSGGTMIGANGSVSNTAITGVINGSQLAAGLLSGMRNRIINGTMVIDQRNAGANVTPTTSGDWYGADRWVYNLTESSKFSSQQSSTAPTGFINSILITSLSAYSVVAGDVFALTQHIEGLNVGDLGWGTASAKTVTLSFQVRSSLTGTFGGALQNSARNRSYPFSYTISAANTWETKTITIAGDTTGTWLTTNGIGVTVRLGLGMGSTYSGTAGAWAASDFRSATGATSVVGTDGATFYITGVQLEVGTQATSFEYRQYGTELALCQRYYQKISWTDSSLATGAAASTSGVNGTPVYFPQEMRTVPTITLPTAGSSAGNASFLTASGGYPATFGSNSTEATRTTGFGIKGTGYTSAFVVGNSSLFFAAGTATIQISAEL